MKKLTDYEYLPEFGIEYHLITSIHKRKNNLQQRKSRIKKQVNRIKNAVTYKYFITLTYNDKSLKQNKKVLTKNLKKFIYENFDYYMFNDDVGDEYGRYHHHGLATTWLSIDELSDRWNYGWIDIQEVQFNMVDFIRVSNYVKKLSHHASKSSASVLRLGRNDERNLVSLALELDVPVIIENERVEVKEGDFCFIDDPDKAYSSDWLDLAPDDMITWI